MHNTELVNYLYKYKTDQNGLTLLLATVFQKCSYQ